MLTVYTLCAVAGSVLIIAQFLLMLLGFGDTEIEALDGVGSKVDVHHDSTLFFGVLSFKSLVAALAFFGLTGRFLEAVGFGALPTFFGALAGGAIAMVGVAWLMRVLVSLRYDGTARIEGATGMHARVYLNVPGDMEGSGKITVQFQNRSMEYDAVTRGGPLATGANALIVGVVDGNTVEVVAVSMDEN